MDCDLFRIRVLISVVFAETQLHVFGYMDIMVLVVLVSVYICILLVGRIEGFYVSIQRVNLYNSDSILE